MSTLRPNPARTTPPRTIPVLVHVKEVYILWHSYASKLPKTAKYSLGLKIDNLLIDTIEAISIAAFLQRAEKPPYLKRAIARVDTLKVFLQLVWEMKLLESKQYGEISEKISEVGKMLGGWYGQVVKQNSPVPTGEK